VALGGQRLEAEDDVLGRDGAAVVEAGLGPQVELDRAAVVRDADRLGEQAVLRERLVERGDQEGLEQEVDARGGRALQDEGVEAVVAADGREGEAPPLGASGFT
jgi:hypothetical protein